MLRRYLYDGDDDNDHGMIMMIEMMMTTMIEMMIEMMMKF